jgi:hypothetical protein
VKYWQKCQIVGDGEIPTLHCPTTMWNEIGGPFAQPVKTRMLLGFNPVQNDDASQAQWAQHFSDAETLSPRAPTHRKVISLPGMGLVRAAIRFANAFFPKRCNLLREADSSSVRLRASNTR